MDAGPIKQPPVLDKRHEMGDTGARLSHNGAFGSQRPEDQPELSATGLDLDKQRFVTHSTQSRSDEGEGITEETTIQIKSGGRSQWTLPTKMPKIDPADFYDPISDRFWIKIWNASAVHNVSSVPYVQFKLNLCTVDRNLP